MTAVSFMDELVREYLLFRGFIATLKAFDADVKNDRDKGFRADKIVEQLCSYISNYDLTSLRETWGHMEQRIFSRLESGFSPTVRKLENSLLKMYLVNAVQTNRHEKLVEFYERCSQDLQNQPEWKDWFALPFLKNPEENPAYSGYFTRQWQDTMLVSLHNFLSVIFQCMPMPVLLSYEDEQMKITQLQEENDMLKQQVSALQARELAERRLHPSDSDDLDGMSTSELMDDFYVLARETPSSDGQLKSIKTIIRNISSGLPTSPILGRRPSAPAITGKKHVFITESESTIVSKTGAKMKPRGSTAIATPNQIHSASNLTISSSLKSRTEMEVAARKFGQPQVKIMDDLRGVRKSPETGSRKTANSSSTLVGGGGAMDSLKESFEQVNIMCEGVGKKTPLLLLSQEEYGEHQSAVTHCKFNASGSLIASSDIDGVIKIWSASPSPNTQATVISKSSILALEWAHKTERLLLLGNKTGIVRVYDTSVKRTLYEVGTDESSPLKDQRIMNLSCSPTESHFTCSTSSKSHSTGSDSQILVPSAGRFLLFDMKTMQFIKQMSVGLQQAVVNCCAFNHNGQLLVGGTTEGKIYLFDMRTHDCITQWQAHQGETYTIQFSADETSCYSLGSGGKFTQWSINKTGDKLSEHVLGENCAGPFRNPSGQSAPRGSVFRPVGKLFAFDSEGKHVLTSARSSALIFNLPSSKELPTPVMRLDGHKAPVVTMDWATTVDCGTCITASLDGKIRASTLLAQ